MSGDDNKRAVAEFVERCQNQHDLDYADEAFHPKFVNNYRPEGRALPETDSCRSSFPRSETLRGVPQAGQPGLGVVALGDDSGDAPADTSQRTPHVLRHVVVHRSSSVPAICSPVTIEFRRKALLAASEESPILPAEMGLSQISNRLILA